MTQEIPVITIDGPSGTGKGTIAAKLAEKLGFYLLDSGALYRALAWSVLHKGINPEEEVALSHLLETAHLELRTNSPVDPPEVWCEDQNISAAIREESVGNMASRIAAVPLVRQHLLRYQRMMRRSPGLIADGRDMGSVIFPDASAKFYLDASPEIRVQRRYNQLKQKGINVSLPDIREDLALRDYRDEHRDIAPMKVMPDMIRIDTSDLNIDEVFGRVMAELRMRLHNLN